MAITVCVKAGFFCVLGGGGGEGAEALPPPPTPAPHPRFFPWSCILIMINY